MEQFCGSLIDFCVHDLLEDENSFSLTPRNKVANAVRSHYVTNNIQLLKGDMVVSSTPTLIYGTVRYAGLIPRLSTTVPWLVIEMLPAKNTSTLFDQNSVWGLPGLEQVNTKGCVIRPLQNCSRLTWGTLKKLPGDCLMNIILCIVKKPKDYPEPICIMDYHVRGGFRAKTLKPLKKNAESNTSVTSSKWRNVEKASVRVGLKERSQECPREVLVLPNAVEETLRPLTNDPIQAVRNGSGNGVQYIVTRDPPDSQLSSTWKKAVESIALKSDEALSVVMQVLDNELNAQDELGVTLLHVAADASNSGIIKLLLGRGAIPTLANVAGQTCLHIIAGKRLEAIEVFEMVKSPAVVKAVNAKKETAFEIALRNGNDSAIVAWKSLYHPPTEGKHVSRVFRLFEEYCSKQSVSTKDIHWKIPHQVMLGEFSNDWNALHFAAMLNADDVTSVVEMITKPKASLLVGAKDSRGITPLHVAAKNGNVILLNQFFSLLHPFDLLRSIKLRDRHNRNVLHHLALAPKFLDITSVLKSLKTQFSVSVDDLSAVLLLEDASGVTAFHNIVNRKQYQRDLFEQLIPILSAKIPPKSVESLTQSLVVASMWELLGKFVQRDLTTKFQSPELLRWLVVKRAPISLVSYILKNGTFAQSSLINALVESVPNEEYAREIISHLGQLDENQMINILHSLKNEISEPLLSDIFSKLPKSPSPYSRLWYYVGKSRTHAQALGKWNGGFPLHSVIAVSALGDEGAIQEVLNAVGSKLKPGVVDLALRNRVLVYYKFKKRTGVTPAHFLRAITKWKFGKYQHQEYDDEDPDLPEPPVDPMLNGDDFSFPYNLSLFHLLCLFKDDDTLQVMHQENLLEKIPQNPKVSLRYYFECNPIAQAVRVGDLSAICSLLSVVETVPDIKFAPAFNIKATDELLKACRSVAKLKWLNNSSDEDDGTTVKKQNLWKVGMLHAILDSEAPKGLIIEVFTALYEVISRTENVEVHETFHNCNFNSVKMSLLTRAVPHGVEVVEGLLRLGVPVNGVPNEPIPPLCLAAYFNNVPLILTLLRAGADVNVSTQQLYLVGSAFKDRSTLPRSSFTPTSLGICVNSLEAWRCLREHGGQIGGFLVTYPICPAQDYDEEEPEGEAEPEERPPPKLKSPVEKTSPLGLLASNSLIKGKTPFLLFVDSPVPALNGIVTSSEHRNEEGHKFCLEVLEAEPAMAQDPILFSYAVCRLWTDVVATMLNRGYNHPIVEIFPNHFGFTWLTMEFHRYIHSCLMSHIHDFSVDVVLKIIPLSKLMFEGSCKVNFIPINVSEDDTLRLLKASVAVNTPEKRFFQMVQARFSKSPKICQWIEQYRDEFPMEDIQAARYGFPLKEKPTQQILQSALLGPGGKYAADICDQVEIEDPEIPLYLAATIPNNLETLKKLLQRVPPSAFEVPQVARWALDVKNYDVVRFLNVPGAQMKPEEDWTIRLESSAYLQSLGRDRLLQHVSFLSHHDPDNGIHLKLEHLGITALDVAGDNTSKIFRKALKQGDVATCQKTFSPNIVLSDENITSIVRFGLLDILKKCSVATSALENLLIEALGFEQYETVTYLVSLGARLSEPKKKPSSEEEEEEEVFDNRSLIRFPSVLRLPDFDGTVYKEYLKAIVVLDPTFAFDVLRNTTFHPLASLPKGVTYQDLVSILPNKQKLFELALLSSNHELAICILQQGKTPITLSDSDATKLITNVQILREFILCENNSPSDVFHELLNKHNFVDVIAANGYSSELELLRTKGVDVSASRGLVPLRKRQDIAKELQTSTTPNEVMASRWQPDEETPFPPVERCSSWDQLRSCVTELKDVTIEFQGVKELDAIVFLHETKILSEFIDFLRVRQKMLRVTEAKVVVSDSEGDVILQCNDSGADNTVVLVSLLLRIPMKTPNLNFSVEDTSSKSISLINGILDCEIQMSRIANVQWRVHWEDLIQRNSDSGRNQLVERVMKVFTYLKDSMWGKVVAPTSEKDVFVIELDFATSGASHSENTLKIGLRAEIDVENLLDEITRLIPQQSTIAERQETSEKLQEEESQLVSAVPKQHFTLCIGDYGANLAKMLWADYNTFFNLSVQDFKLVSARNETPAFQQLYEEAMDGSFMPNCLIMDVNGDLQGRRFGELPFWNASKSDSKYDFLSHFERFDVMPTITRFMYTGEFTSQKGGWYRDVTKLGLNKANVSHVNLLPSARCGLLGGVDLFMTTIGMLSCGEQHGKCCVDWDGIGVYHPGADSYLSTVCAWYSECTLKGSSLPCEFGGAIHNVNRGDTYSVPYWKAPLASVGYTRHKTDVVFDFTPQASIRTTTNLCSRWKFYVTTTNKMFKKRSFMTHIAMEGWEEGEVAEGLEFMRSQIKQMETNWGE